MQPDQSPQPAERPTQQGRGAQPLAGCTVGVTAARRADELCALLERRGATVWHAPAMRTVPLEDDSELLGATRKLTSTPPDVVIGTTAVGFRGWLEAAGGWGLREELLERFGAAEILARGPKVRGAIRAAGLREDWSPASEAMAEVRDRLLAQGVSGRRIALQLHGEPLPGLIEALREAGAEVVPVPVYRWLPPEDHRPLDRLTDGLLDGTVQAVTFTSAPAAASMLRRAAERGVQDALLETLRQRALAACVGPVTAQPLVEHGVPTLQPERFRLGPMVQLLGAELPPHLSALREPGTGQQ